MVWFSRDGSRRGLPAELSFFFFSFSFLSLQDKKKIKKIGKMERTVYITLQIGARHERRRRELDGVCAIHTTLSYIVCNWPLVLFSLGYCYDCIIIWYLDYLIHSFWCAQSMDYAQSSINSDVTVRELWNRAKHKDILHHRESYVKNIILDDWKERRSSYKSYGGYMYDDIMTWITKYLLDEHSPLANMFLNYTKLSIEIIKWHE